MFLPEKNRPLANCTTLRGGSGKGLARALDLIFSPFAPGRALPAKLFNCHKRLHSSKLEKVCWQKEEEEEKKNLTA